MSQCHDFTCGNVRIGAAFTPDQCRKCWAALHIPEVAKSLGRKADPISTPPPDPEPLRIVRLDGSRLAGGEAHSAQTGHSNASIIRFGGKLFLAYRYRNAGADVWLTELDEDTYQPHGPGRKLDLKHFHAQHGREDPRLFIHRDKLHVIYVGVEGKAVGPTSQLIAQLANDGRVERRLFLDLPGREKWEKNWAPFEYHGELYAVYSIAPHVIIRIRPDGRCERAAETPTPHEWSGGHLRGGAAPVRVGDEFFHWFHGRIEEKYGKPTYTTGVYTFEAKPPFRVTRMTSTPVMYGDSRTRPADWFVNNWFPCGAILEGQTWIVSAGEHDQWVNVAEWDAGEICKRLLTPAGVKAAKPCGCGK